MRRRRKKCCKTPHNLVVIRQLEKYKEFENVGCDWVEVERFRCSEHYWGIPQIGNYGNGSAFAPPETYEGVEYKKTFNINVNKQDKRSDFNVKEGDYMFHGRELFKLISVKPIEIMRGCFWIRIIGENLYPREHRTLLLETSDSDTGTPDDFNDFMAKLGL